MNIRVLIVDDHPIVREGLRALLDSELGIELAGEAKNGTEALIKVFSLNPDVTLMDLVMPEMDGIECIRKIRSQDPEKKILVLTSFADEDKVFPAIKAGALGYLLKDSPPGQLIQAIRDVHKGVASLHPSIALMVIQELNQPSELPPTDNPLTEREMTVLKLVAQGHTNREIKDHLVISEWTVRMHIRNILSKLHLANRTQAALYALREGIVDLE